MPVPYSCLCPPHPWTLDQVYSTGCEFPAVEQTLDPVRSGWLHEACHYYTSSTSSAEHFLPLGKVTHHSIIVKPAVLGRLEARSFMADVGNGTVWVRLKTAPFFFFFTVFWF